MDRQQNPPPAVAPSLGWDELANARFEAVPDGMSGALLFRVIGEWKRPRYLKIARDDAMAPLREEISRTQWLDAQGFRVPPILRVEDSGDQVVMFTRAVRGLAAEDSTMPVDRLIDALASGLSALHRMSPLMCPFDESVSVRLARAADAIAAGTIDAAGFDPRNRHKAPEELYRWLKENAPEREDTVVVHGDATLDNMMVDDDGNVGFVDCGNAGRGDRYIDLAIVTAQLDEYYGEDAVAHFLRVYGLRHWDEAKARYFLDLYELF